MALRVERRLDALLATRRDAVVVVREHRKTALSIYWARNTATSIYWAAKDDKTACRLVSYTTLAHLALRAKRLKLPDKRHAILGDTLYKQSKPAASCCRQSAAHQRTHLQPSLGEQQSQSSRSHTNKRP